MADDRVVTGRFPPRRRGRAVQRAPEPPPVPTLAEALISPIAEIRKSLTNIIALLDVLEHLCRARLPPADPGGPPEPAG